MLEWISKKIFQVNFWRKIWSTAVFLFGLNWLEYGVFRCKLFEIGCFFVECREIDLKMLFCIHTKQHAERAENSLEHLSRHRKKNRMCQYHYRKIAQNRFTKMPPNCFVVICFIFVFNLVRSRDKVWICNFV